MLKSGDYIQMLVFFYVNSNFIQKYSHAENIDYLMTAKRLDELRVLHLKFKQQCDQFNLYPHLDKKIMEMLKNDISTICNEFKIRPTFVGEKTTEYKKGFHCYYHCMGSNITDLIVFNKIRKESQVSHMNIDI